MPDNTKIQDNDTRKLALELLKDLQQRKETRTTIMDRICNFLDEWIQTNLVFSRSKSQPKNIEEKLNEKLGQYAEKIVSSRNKETDKSIYFKCWIKLQIV